MRLKQDGKVRHGELCDILVRAEGRGKTILNFCHNKCEDYPHKLTAQVGSDGRYLNGRKRCKICGVVYIRMEGSRCPCCGNRLRLRPRTRTARARAILVRY